MRVIAGKAKGRKLLAVPGDSTRPIMDRVKTALFNKIQFSLEGSAFLDLFAGTGAVGIEALSRGADKAIFIDLNKNAYQTIKKNLEHTELDSQAEVRNTDAFSYLQNTAKVFDFIYIDPPQFNNFWTEALQKIAERPELLSEQGQVIIKIHPKEDEKYSTSTLNRVASKKYGNSMLIYFSKK